MHSKTFLYTLRFVQFGRKGNRDRWINYRVFKWLPRNGSKQGEFSRRCQLACSKPSPPCFAVSTEPWQKCFTSQLKYFSNVEEELSRKPPLCNPRMNYRSLSRLWLVWDILFLRPINTPFQTWQVPYLLGAFVDDLIDHRWKRSS